MLSCSAGVSGNRALPVLFPRLQDRADVLKRHLGAHLALADVAAPAGMEEPDSLADRGVDLFPRAPRQEPLAVEFSPERYAARETAREVIHVHDPHLGVQCIDAYLDQVFDDLGDIAVAVKEEEPSGPVGRLNVFPVTGLEVLSPEPRGDEKLLLRAPVIVDADAVGRPREDLIEQLPEFLAVPEERGWEDPNVRGNAVRALEVMMSCIAG